MSLTKHDLQQIRVIIKEEIDEEVVPLKNDLVKFKDDILTEIIKLREDVTIVIGYRGLIGNHEERLEVVENHLGINPS